MEKQDVTVDKADAPVATAAAVPTTMGTTTTTTITMINAARPPAAFHDNEKQGAKCCGFCCDMRRAVIILNIIFLILSVITLITYLVGPSILYQDFDDDDIAKIVEDSYTSQSIFSGVSVGVSALVIFGANRYNMILVSLGILWLIAQFIAGVVITLTTYNDLEETYNGSETLRALPYFSFVIQGVITALLIYPHVGLIMEIKKGIITPDTYHREEFSCCCA